MRSFERERGRERERAAQIDEENKVKKGFDLVTLFLFFLIIAIKSW